MVWFRPSPLQRLHEPDRPPTWPEVRAMNGWLSTKKQIFWILSATALTTILLLALLPADVFWITDCAAKYLTSVNLEKKQYRDFAIDYPGAGLDPSLIANPIPNPLSVVQEGRIYSYYPPLFPILAAPFHALFGFYGLFILPLAGSFLTFWLVVKLAKAAGLSRGLCLLSGLTVYWCTPCLFYTFCFWEHTLANAAVLFSLYLLLKENKGSAARSLLLAGAVLGLATGLREEFLLLAAAIFVALFLDKATKKRRIPLFLLGNAAGLIPVGLFQHWAIGSALGFHTGNNLMSSAVFQNGTINQIIAERFKVVFHLLGNISTDETATFFYLLVFVAALLLGLVIRRRTGYQAAGLMGLCVLLAAGSLLIFLTAEDTIKAWFSGNGLFLHGALLIPGLAIIPAQGKRGLRLLRRTSILFIALLCLTAPPLTNTGLHWGPRLMLPVYPLLVIPAFAFLSRALPMADRRKILIVAGFTLLVLVCFFTQLYAFSVLDEKLESAHQVMDALAALPERIVISDVWWFPQDMAALFYDKIFLFSKNSATLNRLRDAMKRQGVKQYLYVTWNRPGLAAFWTSDSALKLYDIALCRRKLD